MNDEQFNKMIQRLDALLKVALSTHPELDNKGKAVFLSEIGFTSSEIASIINLTPGAVRTAVSRAGKK